MKDEGWPLRAAYLQRHLDEHQELFDADPDALSSELMGDTGAFFIREAPQQLQGTRHFQSHLHERTCYKRFCDHRYL